MNPRAPKNPELVLELPGIQGDLRWNQRGFFRAQCYHPGHGRTCRRQQQSTEGRFGAGRPIGLLIAWLQTANDHDTHSSHVGIPAEARPIRQAARAWFSSSVPDADTFLQLERGKYTDESDDEPEMVP